MTKCYIVLENGDIFEGKRFGAAGETMGELVFTTAMTGYIETLTDPSYYGEIIMQTFPLIGNYGVMDEDSESRKCFAKGYVVREWCDLPSNFRSEGDIDAYLKKHNIIGVYDVDTREITRRIREKGVMNAKIVDVVTPEIQEELKAYSIDEALKAVSETSCKVFDALGETLYSVALMDYGAKLNIIRELNKRGCKVTLFPYDASAEEVLKIKPDGLMLSNGPGDPQGHKKSVMEVQKMFGKLPIFGICLGHQILALAAGAKTRKLKYGHRGENQPVKRLRDGRVFVSTQNHGYAVINDTISKDAVLSYVNANDDTCEGIDYPKHNAFSVQFHPEACGGPKDTEFLFDHFIDLMKGSKK